MDGQSIVYIGSSVSRFVHSGIVLISPDIDSSGSHGRYPIEYQGRNVSDDRALLCSYGKVKRLFRFADVSNSDITDVSSILLGLMTS